MGRINATFRQADVTRALKGAQAAGMEVGRVEIDAAGTIVVITKTETAEPVSVLEKWKRDHAGAS